MQHVEQDAAGRRVGAVLAESAENSACAGLTARAARRAGRRRAPAPRRRRNLRSHVARRSAANRSAPPAPRAARRHAPRRRYRPASRSATAPRRRCNARRPGAAGDSRGGDAGQPRLAAPALFHGPRSRSPPSMSRRKRWPISAPGYRTIRADRHGDQRRQPVGQARRAARCLGRVLRQALRGSTARSVGATIAPGRARRAKSGRCRPASAIARNWSSVVMLFPGHALRIRLGG